MERHLKRHQQPVTDGAARGAGEPAASKAARGRDRLRGRWLAPMLCVLAALCALVLGAGLITGVTGGLASDQAEPAPQAKAGSPRAAEGSDASGDAAEPKGDQEAGSDAAASDELAGGSDAAAVDASTFLSVLERSAAADAQGEASCTWTADEPIDELAADVLRTYRDTAGCQLMTSGYLDLKGNAWGGIVLNAEGWVDVIVVAAEKGDASSTVRIARMSASSAPGDTGSR